MDYKKIVSVVASAVMITSTIGFAAASSYPSPFTDGAAVVYGTAGANSDMAAAIDIYNQLKNRASGTTEASVTGEAKAIETASQKLYIGDVMNLTKKTLTSDDLPTVLATGSLNGADGKTYKYDQKIEVPNTKTIYGKTPDNLASPVVYTDFDSNNYYYTLKVIFPTAVNPANLSNEAISLFGKNYVFSGTESDLTTTQLVFYEKATPVIVNDGESVTVDGHTISVAVEDADTAAITVDGTTSSKTEGWSGKIGGVDLYLKNVVGPNVAGTSRYVELYLNSNKLVLSNGDDVTLGSDTVDGTSVTITTSGASKISEVAIKITPYQFDDSLKYLKIGDGFVDPVFKTVKFQLSSVNPDLTADVRDKITLKASGEKKASIEFTNKAGKEYSLDFLRPSTSCITSAYAALNATCSDGTWAYNATQIGYGTDYDLITSGAGINNSDYAMTCSAEYTQIWEVKSIKPSDTKVKLQDIGSGSSPVEISLTSGNIGATGSLTLADGNSATITLTGNTTGSEGISLGSSCAKIYTKKGALIDLSFANAPTSVLSEVRITQETPYNGGAGNFLSNDGTSLGANNVTIKFAYYKDSQSGKDMKIGSVLSGTSDGSVGTDFWSSDVGDYDYYYLTDYGTFVKQTGDTDKQVDVYYPENAMSVGFYIGENAAQISPGTTGTPGGQIQIVKDTPEELAGVKDKHLIVVGGSCVNTVAAKILKSDVPLCGADFSLATEVNAGGYIIKVVESPYNTAKIAMLVAGYNAADTTTAAKRAMVIDGVKTEVGTTETFPVVG